MQSMPAYVNQETRRTELALTLRGRKYLIQRSSDCQRNQRDDERHGPHR
jgi:hypothetical protein